MKRKNQHKFFPAFLVLLLLCGAWGCESQGAKRAFEQGEKLYQRGAYLEAIRNWEIILSSYPKSAWADDALHWIGVTYYVELDLPDRAISSFSRLIQDYPGSSYAPQDLILVTEIFRNQRQYSKALTEYARFLKLFPEDENLPRVWYNLITCLFEVDEYQAMRVQAEAFLKKFPESEWADDVLYWMGQSYFLEGDQKRAQEYFKKYLEQYPEGELTFKVQMSLARSLEEEGYLKEAIEVYRDLKERYPSEGTVELRLKSAEKRWKNKQAGTIPVPEEE